MQSTRKYSTTFYMAASIFLISCGMHMEKKGSVNAGSTQTKQQPGNTSPTANNPPNTNTNPNATFQWIKANIIDSSCIRCHSASGKASDFPFSSYDEVIATGTIKATPEESSFYVLVDTAKMPPRSPRLEETLVKAIYDWIKAGAPNN